MPTTKLLNNCLFTVLPFTELPSNRYTLYLILTAELWTERVMLYYVEDVPGAWSYTENIKSVVIDSDVGTSFEANFVDLNADGK